VPDATVSATRPIPAIVAHRRRPPTRREVDVLRLLADGLTTQQIGNRLFIAGCTVKTHTARLRQMLGAATNAHLVAIAYQLGLLYADPPPPPAPSPTRLEAIVTRNARTLDDLQALLDQVQSHFDGLNRLQAQFENLSQRGGR
jgi:DNA-binding CsgD family transcriptional regulator